MEFLIASRRDRPGDDPIFSLNAQAKERRAAGESIVNATIGALLDDDGKLMVMPSVLDAVRGLEPHELSAYAPIAGRPEFLDAVIADLTGDSGLADRAVAVATPGGSGALRAAIENFSEPGDAILTSSFFWGPYRTLATESGRGLTTYNMFGDDGRLDAADFEAELGALLDKQGRALVFLNTPCHNPTGYSLDADEWAALSAAVERLADRGPITLLIDVAYAAYQPGGLARCLEGAKPILDKTLVLFAWSASKSFAQYGQRIGSLVALAADPEERTRIKNALTFSCRGMWSNCNAGGMAAVAKLLADPELAPRALEDRAGLIALLGKRVARWNELAGPAGLKYPRYDGGFFTTVFHDDAPAVCARLRERGVFLVPLAKAMRVALCAVPEAEIPRVVEAIAAEV